MKTNYFKTILLFLLFSASANAQLRPVNQLNNRIDSLKKALLKKDSLKNEELAQKKLDRLYKLEKDYKNKLISEKKYQMKVIRLLSDSLDEDATETGKADKEKEQLVVVKKYLNNKLIDSTSYDSTKVESKKYLPFYFRVYSDAKGFQKDQPNGLLQTEFGFTWQCKAFKIPLGKCNLYFLKNLQLPQVSLFQNKSDTSYRYTPVHYDKTVALTDTNLFKSRLNVHTLNLVKYAHYSVSGKLNVLAIECNKKCLQFYLDAFGTFYATGVSYDSTTYKLLKTRKEDAKFQVFSAGGGFNAKFIIRPPKTYFSLEASYTHFSLLLLNNDIKQSYGKLYNPDYNEANYKAPLVRSYNGQSLSQVAIYNIELKYSPTRNDKKKDNTGMFLRFNFFTNPFIGFDTKPNYGNNYTQIQVGVSQTFEELLNFLGMEKPK